MMEKPKKKNLFVPLRSSDSPREEETRKKVTIKKKQQQSFDDVLYDELEEEEAGELTTSWLRKIPWTFHFAP